MDTSNLLSTPVFLGFLLSFFYLSIAGYSSNLEAPPSGESRRPSIAQVVLILKYACVIITTLSGLAIVNSLSDIRWWQISGLSFGLLLILAMIDRTSALLMVRRSAWSSRLARPLLSVLTRRTMRRPHKRIDIVENHDSSRNLFSENPTGFEKQALTNEVLLNLDQRDREMLRSILRLDISTAREVMVPRLDIVAIHASATPAEAAVLMAQSGHSRLPVYEDTIDHISGIVHSRDLLDLLAHPKPDKSLKDFWRPAFFIPESKRLDDLLEELQEKALQLVIVVDEYGGTEGLVTMEDLLEEVFGEIEDEFSRTLEPQIVHQANNAALVDAKVTTEAIEELFSIKIDIQDVDTVGGYVYHMLGKIPQIGDVVTTNDLQIEVISVLGRRLRKLRIKPVDNSISKPDA